MDEQTATPKARTMEFSTRLKDLRAQSALSQEQLARRIGVSRQAITKWESGAGRPELESLVALADVFAVSIDALLGLDDAHAGRRAANTGTKAPRTTTSTAASISTSTAGRSTRA